jgi:hypothetical protein
LKPAVLLVIFTLLTDQEIDFCLLPYHIPYHNYRVVGEQNLKKLTKEETGFVTKKKHSIRIKVKFYVFKM